VIDKLEEVIIAHKLWLESDGEQGERLYFPEVDWSCINFTEEVLMRAHLSRANLSFADFTRADLRKINLLKANLTQADFTGADLRGANLVRADLTKATLQGAFLAGCDLSGAKLEGTGVFSFAYENIKGWYYEDLLTVGGEYHNLLQWRDIIKEEQLSLEERKTWLDLFAKIEKEEEA